MKPPIRISWQVLLTALIFTPALAGDEKPPQKPAVKVGGYVDGFFQTNFGLSPTGDTLNGRGLDIANNQPTIAFAQLEFSLEPKPFGFNVQLYAGRGPELIHLTEPGGKNKYRFVRQAYGTYVTPGKTQVTLDFGKFDTWIGYEGIDNRYQDQYSRSFNWTYSETTYETGLRASAKLSAKMNAALYVVQGWNEVEDGNRGKTVGGTLTYSPDDKTSYTLQDHFGVEGSNRVNDAGSYGGIAFPQPGTSNVHLLDFIVSRQITPKTKVAFNVDYANSESAPNNGKWNGEVLYLRTQLKPDQAASLRFDRFEDSDGLRSGSRVKLYSATATYDYTVSKNATMRLELRQDLASEPFFNSNSILKKDGTSLTLAAVVKF